MKHLPHMFIMTLSLFSIACDQKEPHSNEPISSTSEISEIPPYAKHSYKTTSPKNRKKLFGKFYCDRAEFFIIKAPQTKLYTSSPNEIILYYLDGQLSKTQYKLTEDIGSALMKTLGKFSISGKDWENKSLISQGHILNRSKNSVRIAQELDNYQLKWSLGGTEVLYRVDKRVDPARYIYEEQEILFEKDLEQIEKNCF